MDVTSRYTAAGLRPEVLDVEAARSPWARLAERSANVFATWEWARAWLRHFGAAGTPHIVLWRDEEGEPVVLMPLFLARRGPVRLVRFIGHGPGDELGPVCAAQDRPRAAAALYATLRALGRRWDVLLGERLPPSSAWTGAAGVSLVRTEPSPTLSLQGRGWEDVLAARSANFRQQVRRRERKLARAGDLRFRLSTTPDTVRADLDRLMVLHDARWAEAGSGAFDGPRRAFHREWATTALERGWLRLWTLELDGAPAAAWYGFRYAQRESYYQSGRDPQRQADSVGFVLLAHTIREAAQDGMLEYRFLRGGEAYKDRFADGDAPVETVLLARSAAGRLAGRLAIEAQRRAPGTRRIMGRVAGQA